MLNSAFAIGTLDVISYLAEEIPRYVLFGVFRSIYYARKRALIRLFAVHITQAKYQPTKDNLDPIYYWIYYSIYLYNCTLLRCHGL